MGSFLGGDDRGARPILAGRPSDCQAFPGARIVAESVGFSVVSDPEIVYPSDDHAAIRPFARVDMDLSFAGRFRRLLPGALLVLAGYVGAAPVARAGCSHDVRSGAAHSGLDALADLAILRPAKAGPSLPAPWREPPCSGPSCSRGPSVPYAPALLPSLRSEPWCSTTVVPRPSAPEPADGLADPGPLRPTRRASLIERPPRLSRSPLI